MKIIHLQEKRQAYHNYSTVLLDVVEEAFSIGQVDAARMMAFVPGTEQAIEVAQFCHPHFVEGSAVLIIGTYNPMYSGNGDPFEKNGDRFSNASVQSFFKSVPVSAGLAFEELWFDFFDLVPFVVPIVNPWNPDGTKLANFATVFGRIVASVSEALQNNLCAALTELLGVFCSPMGVNWGGWNTQLARVMGVELSDFQI